ncbi:MAG: hypothetical protein WC683_06230 [bacterium]
MIGANQWLRRFTLEVGEGLLAAVTGVAIQSNDAGHLRVSFVVERDERPWPNQTQIKIWNLNPDHRKNLEGKRGIPVRLSAGYKDNQGTVFDGFLRDAVSTHDGEDWVTTITGGDGECNSKGEPLASGSISKTWKKGTPLATIALAFAKEMKVDLGASTAAAGAAKLLTGAAVMHAYTVDGPIVDEFIYFMRSVGLKWSIQNGALQIRVADAPAGIAPLISPFTGLLGSTSASTRKVQRTNQLTQKVELQEIAVLEGRCLLLPNLLPGQQLLVQSTATGVPKPYLCTRVRQVGDTHGQEWYTEFEGNN